MPKFRILCHVCTEYMSYSEGAHMTLEMLEGMLDSSDHSEKSSTDQGRAKASNVVCCSVKCWICLTKALHILHEE